MLKKEQVYVHEELSLDCPSVSMVNCITYTAPPRQYRLGGERNLVTVSGHYIGVARGTFEYPKTSLPVGPIGIPIIYPCHVELDSFGDDISR